MALNDNDKKTIREAFDLIKQEMAESAPANEGEESKFNVHGVGTFKIARTKTRNGRNPQTGETVKVASRLAPKLSFSKTFLD